MGRHRRRRHWRRRRRRHQVGGGFFAGERRSHEGQTCDGRICPDVSQARFCESVEAAHSSQDDTARVAARLRILQPPFRIDSQCKYAAVARGDASIYMRLPTRKDYEEKIWDHAAGMAVVQEAGGRVTDVAGRDLDFSLGRTLRSNQGVVVTNGHIHDQVIEAVREVLGITD